MALILYKWLLISFFALSGQNNYHPIFVSVTEIEHNAKESTLEISCKIFTDDFEKALRKVNKQKIDLMNPALKESMNKVVNDYVQKHMSIKVNGDAVKMQYVGYEEQEEGIICYFQVNNVREVKELYVLNHILFDDQPQQISLLHVTVNGNRKSTKLNNPENTAVFKY
jgi:hypothetical protein